MTIYLDTFLDHRRKQEEAHLARIRNSQDPMASLISVEVNVTELCNRVCAFCPRVDPNIYPNRNLSMALDIARKVAEDLASMNYGGRISFSGYGEPLLNKQFCEHLRIFRSALPDNTIETNTNGDKLTIESIKEMYAAGIDAVYVNLYDGPEQVDHFAALFDKAGISENQFTLRAHWEGAAEDFGLTLNNRSGMVVNPDLGVVPLEKALGNRCYYPFYKMFVDWNGNVLFCANDWGREIIVGNVMETDIRSIWLSPRMREIRDKLAVTERDFRPCNICSVDGTLHGKSSFDTLMNYYADAEAADKN
jgi:radical SAM protein with 4Fe4S-binding SPASM domain